MFVNAPTTQEKILVWGNVFKKRKEEKIYIYHLTYVSLLHGASSGVVRKSRADKTEAMETRREIRGILEESMEFTLDARHISASAIICYYAILRLHGWCGGWATGCRVTGSGFDSRTLRSNTLCDPQIVVSAGTQWVNYYFRPGPKELPSELRRKAEAEAIQVHGSRCLCENEVIGRPSRIQFNIGRIHNTALRRRIAKTTSNRNAMRCRNAKISSDTTSYDKTLTIGSVSSGYAASSHRKFPRYVLQCRRFLRCVAAT
ncbi:hypothetical protein SFRURICE_019018 [Spodoptera frugiperda]|nr:hypothetical protein SFRURICE_019018 [Spodoptera frugiperda]